MRVVSIGGGPAGLYTAVLLKKAFPSARITVHERNRPDDTFGWGVVFSKETLGHFEAADPESYRTITERFAYWDDIETYYDGQCITSTGHGFCGMSRRELLLLLQRRCRELDVELRFEHEIKSAREVAKEADLVLAADGVHSLTREELKAHFRPSLDWRKAKFCWLGTTLPLRAFTFHFKKTPHGVFQVHAYPFQKGLSTWIVECHEDVWRRAGLETSSEADTVAFCEELFRSELQGHKLLSNKSIWRTFPTIRNERWFHQNVVLMGDAAHTAHFSIGSGTKLAMEDAIALASAVQRSGPQRLREALEAYEQERQPEVLRLQKAAQTSLEWFENSARYFGQPSIQFSFNLMTRSKRITYENLKERDPKLIADFDRWFAKTHHAPLGSTGTPPPPMFAPFKLRQLELHNRIAVSPMCQYSAVDGTPNDWHLVHLGSRAVGGAALVMTEMTNVSAQGRITYGCAGMYAPEHVTAWKRIVDFVHTQSSAKIGIQLAHAGRKGSCTRTWEGDRPLRADEGAWGTLGPSALPFGPGWHTPKEMTLEDMAEVKAAFVASTRMALDAGFDLVELHAGHGYLLSSFLSPLSNRRTDGFGGDFAKRMKFPLEVFDAVRAVWPSDKPMSVRISATDWLDDGMTPEDAVVFSRALREHGCDLIDVSSAGNVPESKPEYGRMYQVPYAEKIRYEAKVPVMAVGAILGADHANTVIGAGRADLCALARPHLSDPYLTSRAAQAYGYDQVPWPKPYLDVRPKPKP